MKRRLLMLLIVLTILAGPGSITFAGDITREKVLLPRRCADSQPLIVLPGARVPALLGSSIAGLSLYKTSATGLTPIAYQVDSKDEEGRYQLEGEPGDSNASEPPALDENDELVFLAEDSGRRYTGGADTSTGHRLIELELVDPVSGDSSWIYVQTGDAEAVQSRDRLIHYDADNDRVETGRYRIGFSRDTPFLIDSLHWKQGSAGDWSADITDTMKIRHQGKMFGFIPFKRTGSDYSSRLVAVKTGPVRIIRRTENRVHVMLGLKTPALYVDYVMAPDGFVMDTIIDIPFKVGLFFSDVDTLTTVDWSSRPDLPELYVESPANTSVLVINGSMSAEKRALNESNATQFAIYNSLGGMLVSLEISDDFPITPWLYLQDTLAEADPPEQEQGQFGNIGFRTTGWENIGTQVHHLKFRVCMTAAKHPDTLPVRESRIGRVR